MDFILFKFNSRRSTRDKANTKDNNNKLTVYNPNGGLYGMSLAAVVERLGWFDYNFTSTNSDGEKFMVCSNYGGKKTSGTHI